MDTSHDEESECNNSQRVGLAGGLQQLRTLLNEVCGQLGKQNVKGTEGVKIRDTAISDLEDAVKYIDTMEEVFGATALTATRLNVFEAQMKELSDIVKAQSAATKSYAQVASTIPLPLRAQKQIQIREHKQKLHEERVKYQVTLTASAATEEVKKSLATLSPKELTQRCQHAIKHANNNAILNGVRPLPNNNLRLHCRTEEEAQQLQRIDWSKAFDGLTPHKPQYGIVVHSVSKEEINFETTSQNAIIDKLQKFNSTRDIRITKVKPLRRKPRLINNEGQISTNQSIVIFTDDKEAANRCIYRGIHVNYSHHDAERYTPQLQITQCYNCTAYGHRATHSKSTKPKCSKCGQNHVTDKCESTEVKCGQCERAHESYHRECPVRQAERRRLFELKFQTSPYFT